jgi:succinoglycan biosynthesis protein ExoA
MQVSVIVPVRNEGANLPRTLLGLARQNLDPAEFEVLVIDGSSEDNTVEVVREMQASFANLRLLFNPKRWSSAARNLGARNARGTYIVIVDGHCEIADRSYLSNLIAAFESSGADTLGRPQPLKVERATPFQLAVSAARSSWLGHNPDSAIYSDRPRFVQADNVAVAYRRDIFDRVGFFDESFDACEDVEFNTRCRKAGLTCYFTPSISVDYQPRSSLRGLLVQMKRYGQGRARLGRKDPRSITPPSLVPPMWLVWLGVSGFASLVWTPAAVAFLASLACYLVVILGESFRVWRHSWGVSFYRLPTIFAAIHAGFGWGYLLEAVRIPSVAIPNRLGTRTSA